MNFFKKTKKGFTLVELVVVIAVIAVLAAVSVGAYFGVTESANNSRSEQEAKQAFTQLQTKTLAGLELGNSGMSVQLGRNGLTFNGLYDNNVLNSVSSLVFDEGEKVDVIALDSVANVADETTENARVYFLADNSSGSIVAEYMGYVPAKLSTKYIKYLNLGSGEFTKKEDITKTYNNEILNGLSKKTIKLSDFTIPDGSDGYTEIATADNNYLAKVNISNKTKPAENFDGIFQLNKGSNRGIYSNNPLGEMKYVSVNWADNDGNNDGDHLYIGGTRAVTYSVDSVPSSEKEAGVINYPNNFTTIAEEVFYTRTYVPSSGSAVYFEDITYYYVAGNVPQVPTALTLSHTELKVHTFDNIQLTADIDVTWSSSDESFATVDANGLVTSKSQYGNVIITATSVDNPDLNEQCEITYFELVEYSAGLVTDLSQLNDGDQVIFIASTIVDQTEEYFLMSSTFDTGSKYYAGVDVASMTSTTFENYNLSFTNETEFQSFTIRNATKNQSGVEITGKNVVFETGTNTALSLGYPAQNELGTGATKNSSGEYYNSCIFTLSMEDDCRVNINSYNVKDKYVRFNYNSGNTRFKSYSIGNSTSPIYIYKLGHTFNNQITSFEIEPNISSCYVNESATFTYKANSHIPSFAQLPDNFATYLTYTSNNTDVATITADGVLTAAGVGSSMITASYQIDANTTIISKPYEFVVMSDEKTEGNFYEVENVSELTAGDKILIVASNIDVALGAKYKSYYSAASSVTRMGKEIQFNSATFAGKIITLEDAENNMFALKTDEGYLRCGENTYTSLYPTEELNDYGKYTISISEGITKISALADEASLNNTIYYTTEYQNFSSYSETETENVENVKVYKLYGEISSLNEATMSFANDDNRTTFNTSIQQFEENDIVFTNEKHESASDVADYVNPIRIYKGSKIIISYESNIKAIKFVCSSSNYANALSNSLQNYNPVYDSSNKTVSVSLDGSSTTFEFENTGGAFRLYSLVVYY